MERHDLLGLPNELLGQIWEYLQSPDDVVNFALICKENHIQGAQYLLEHQDLRQRFTHLVAQMNYHWVISLAAYLKHFILNPRCALYVETVFIEGWRDDWGDDPHFEEIEEPEEPEENEELEELEETDENEDLGIEDLRDQHSQYCKRDMSLSVELVKSYTWIADIYEWIDWIKVGNEDPIVALLLTLLPNDRNLYLAHDCSSSGCIYQIIDREAERPGSGYLPKLEWVEIHKSRIDSYDTLDALKSFANHPSVNTILCSGMGTDEEESSNYEVLEWNKTSSVERLEFVGSGVKAEEFLEFLKNFKALKVFISKKPDRRLGEFDPFPIRAALEAHASHSLEKLTLLPTTEQGSYIGSLEKFERLKKLVTDINCFRHNDDGASSLVEALPPSIEDIVFSVPEYTNAAAIDKMIEEMLLAKETQLHSLKTLTLVVREEVLQEILFQKKEERALLSGVRLELYSSFERLRNQTYDRRLRTSPGDP